jgi:hypothetical protein
MRSLATVMALAVERGPLTAAIVAFAGALTACDTPSPEAELRELIAAAERAAEQRDIGFFRDLIAPSYADSNGNDRDRLLRFVSGYLLANPDPEIITAVDGIVLQGEDAAEVVVRAGFAGSTRRALLGGAEEYLVELELINDGSDWLVIGADWQSTAEDQ